MMAHSKVFEIGFINSGKFPFLPYWISIMGVKGLDER